MATEPAVPEKDKVPDVPVTLIVVVLTATVVAIATA
jgi:hypothetical protein